MDRIDEITTDIIKDVKLYFREKYSIELKHCRCYFQCFLQTLYFQCTIEELDSSVWNRDGEIGVDVDLVQFGIHAGHVMKIDDLVDIFDPDCEETCYFGLEDALIDELQEAISERMGNALKKSASSDDIRRLIAEAIYKIKDNHINPTESTFIFSDLGASVNDLLHNCCEKIELGDLFDWFNLPWSLQVESEADGQVAAIDFEFFNTSDKDPVWLEVKYVDNENRASHVINSLTPIFENDWFDNEEEKDDGEDTVNHPSHYTQGGIEVHDFIDSWNLDFDTGNVVKYVIRAPYKNGLEDLKKAEWYLKSLIKKAEKKEEEE